MPDIIISATGIHHILSNLKPHTAAGSDTIPPTFLKELSHQITYTRTNFQQISTDWPGSERLEGSECRPISKKGDKHNPCNYIPISLTCIMSKCMEHIIVSNIMRHLDSNKILYALQHGFRKKLSCDTFFPSSRTCPATPHKLI